MGTRATGTNPRDLRTAVKHLLDRYGPRLTWSELRQATGQHDPVLRAVITRNSQLFRTVKLPGEPEYVEVIDTYR